MLGAIIGDVAGSYYEVLEIENRNRGFNERVKILDKNTPLFTENSTYTDDSVLTCAIYDAIVNGNKNYEKYLRSYGLKELSLGGDKFGRNRFGSGFVDWLLGNGRCDSYGNGCAMRVSPIGYLFDTLEDVKRESKNATIPSHNHKDSIKASEAVAVAIFKLRNGETKEDVIEYIKNNYYNLDYDLEDLQRNNKFSSKASITVPQAFYIFSIANSFEDTIRKAISIGGDTDTIAAIAGSIAESFYGIPDNIKEEVKEYLTKEQIDLIYNDKRYGGKECKKLLKD